MEKDVVSEPVLGNRIIHIIASVGNPVIIQLLRAEHQHRLVPVLIILDDRKRRESLTETHAVGKNTSVEFLKFIDDGKSSILLKVVEFIPHLAGLETSRFIRKEILRNIIQKLLENIVKSDKVYELRSILLIDIRDIVNYLLRHILELPFIIPEFIKITDVVISHRRRETDSSRTQIISPFKTKFSSSELIERHIDILIFRIIAGKESIHRTARNICLESRFLLNPFGTFACNRPL